MIARVAVALLLAAAVVAVARLAARRAAEGPLASVARPWTRPVLYQSFLLILSLATIAVISGGSDFRGYGFRLPGSIEWTTVVLAGLVVGACGAAVMVLLRRTQLGTTAGFSFLNVVLLVWVWASICEEVFARGLVQGYLGDLGHRHVALGFTSLALPALISGLVFGAMHLTVLKVADARTTALVVLFATALGCVAGQFRAESASLLPAIATHACANVGGMFAGSLLTVALGRHRSPTDP